MKKQWLCGALLAATPLAILAGCSGGSGSLTAPPTNPTAVPPTSIPPTTAPNTLASNLTLGNGQRAILTFSGTGNPASGTIQILAPGAAVAGAKTSAFPFLITVGTYPFTGTISPNGAYSISGNLGTFGAFSMNGTLPTASSDGTYSLTVNGQTETGVVPRIGQPFPTATPTLPPATGNYSLTPNLTFSNLTSDAELTSTPLTSFNDLDEGGTLTNLASGIQAASLTGANGPKTGNGTRRILTMTLSSFENASNLRPFRVGQELPVSAASNLGQYSEASLSGTTSKVVVWRTVSGSAKITAIGSNSISVQLQNVRFEPAFIFGGKGSFTLNGTLVARGLTVAAQ